MSSTVFYTLKPFGKLESSELYDILALRQEVFVVEQNCPYQDADYKDQEAFHLLGYQEDKLVCYTRLLDKGISYEKYSSIGRVLSSSLVRGTGEGKRLMKRSIEACQELFPEIPIKISAQVYLRKFYEDFGFESTGEFYDEDDLPHMGMILDVESSKE